MTDHPIDPYDTDPTPETAGDKPKRHPRPGANPVGRPAVILDGWDPELGTWARQSPTGQILAAIRRGAPRNAAFHRVDLSTSTGDVWMARGREHRPANEFDLTVIPPEHLPYVQFVCAVERTDAIFEVELSEVVWNHAKLNGPFALQLLARKYSHWRDRSRFAASVDSDATPAITEGPSNADLLNLLRAHPEVVEIADRLEMLLTDDTD